MPASFTAYIDEAGDEGFQFRENEPGSSKWFVLSAAVFRLQNSLGPVRIIRDSRTLLSKPHKFVLHFKNLKHEQRMGYVGEIAKEKLLTVSILSYKPDIPDRENYQREKFLLYKYLTRLLVERVSWLCRDMRIQGEGDGTVDLIFSDRSAMSYGDLRQYMTLLKDTSGMQDVRVHWPAINIDRIRAVGHDHLAGLQVADAVASSIFSAVTISRYGHAEPSYLRLLGRHIYRHRNQRIGYGLKFLSPLAALKEKMPHLNAAFENW